jgi:hypothetical protein
MGSGVSLLVDGATLYVIRWSASFTLERIYFRYRYRFGSGNGHLRVMIVASDKCRRERVYAM